MVKKVFKIASATILFLLSTNKNLSAVFTYNVPKEKSILLQNELTHSKKISWKSSDEEIVKIAQNGVAYAVDLGAVSIAATKGENLAAIYDINVTEPEVIKNILVMPNNPAEEEQVALSAIASQDVEKVKFLVNYNEISEEIIADTKEIDKNNYIFSANFTIPACTEICIKTFAWISNNWQESDLEEKIPIVRNKSAKLTKNATGENEHNEITKTEEENLAEATTSTKKEPHNNAYCSEVNKKEEKLTEEKNSEFENVTKKAELIRQSDEVTIEVQKNVDEKNVKLAYNPKRISDNCINFIISYEGFKEKISKDPIAAGNIYDIGYGNVVKFSQTFYNEITKLQATADLIKKLNALCTSMVYNFLNSNQIEYNQHQFDALVSFTFNTGVIWLKDTELANIILECKNLDNIDKNKFINAFLQYHHANKKCYKGLLFRRIDELEIFFYNDYTKDGNLNKNKFKIPECIIESYGKFI